jgi:hypothetical protein
MVIYARILAVPVNFPAELELRYETLDKETGEPAAVFGSPFGSPRYFSWDEIKRMFSIGDALASDCEGSLRQGRKTLVVEAREWEGDWTPRGTAQAAHAVAAEGESKPRCSFCGRPYDIVGKLISSRSAPRAYICDDCVVFLNASIEQHRKTTL